MIYLIPLALLPGSRFLKMLTSEQLQALAYLFVELYPQAYSIGFVFFGFYCLFVDYLIFNSTFLPRTIGVLMMSAALSWLAFLFPPVATALWPAIIVPGVIGEGALTLWLLTKGVNTKRWNELAGPQRGSR